MPTKRTVRQPTKKSKTSKRTKRRTVKRKRTVRQPTKGVYDIWKGLEIDRRSFPTLKLGGKRKSKKSKRKSKRSKKRNNKSKRRRRRRKSMKGGMTMGEKFTGIPYNSTPEHQYPLSSKLNTNVPIGQLGGGLLDSLGLGEISTIKNSLFNGLSNTRNTWIGKEHSISTSPSIHPLMNKEVRYNVPDVNKAFNESVAQAISYKA
tara:strand:- start:6242 stop:6853 length:612 start_codon:yes stop_codon:yes gene_type:complete